MVALEHVLLIEVFGAVTLFFHSVVKSITNLTMQPILWPLAIFRHVRHEPAAMKLRLGLQVHRGVFIQSLVVISPLGMPLFRRHAGAAQNAPGYMLAK